ADRAALSGKKPGRQSPRQYPIHRPREAKVGILRAERMASVLAALPPDQPVWIGARRHERRRVLASESGQHALFAVEVGRLQADSQDGPIVDAVGRPAIGDKSKQPARAQCDDAMRRVVQRDARAVFRRLEYLESVGV